MTSLILITIFHDTAANVLMVHYQMVYHNVIIQIQTNIYQNAHKSLFNARNEWYCNNCSNHNFNRCIDGEDVHKLDKCSLYDIKFIDSITLKIKRH